MTVIRPNSVSGINSITAQADEIKVFKSNGTQGGLIIGGANLNATTGISTILALNVTGNVSIAGTLTYQDVTNVDSLGIGTFRTGINVSGGQLDVGSNIKIGNAGVITATSFSGSGANLTGIDTDLVSDTSPQLGGDLDTNSHHILLDDAHAVKFGDGTDLEIQHSGSHAFMQNATGSLYFDTTGNLYVRNAAGSSTYMYASGNEVALYHTGSKKFQTSSAGVSVTGTVTSDGLVMSDSEEIQLGNSTDVRIYHDSNNTYFKNLTGDLILNSSAIYLNNAAQSATMLRAVQGAGVNLFHNGSTKLETTSTGVTITGAARINYTSDPVLVLNSTNTQGAHIRFLYDGTEHHYVGAGDGFTPSADREDFAIRYKDRFFFSRNGTNVALFDSSNHFVPATTNTHDLGLSTHRWRNIYTNDLNLSNEGSSNSVDNTWGNYTIQEGESDLFLINNRNGKKYKFNLTEVS